MLQINSTSSPQCDQALSPLNMPFEWTEFPDFAARKRFQHRSSLRKIAEDIQTITEDNKHDLPWFKGALFGDELSENGSLRHSANMKRITCIAVDYDGEEVRPEEGARRAREAGIACIIYTSPSHCAEKPRWRVLVVLSEPAYVGMHEVYVAWINGALGGILAPESFTLSQAYFYGGVKDNPPKIIEVEGDFIDRLHHLDAKAIYPGHSRTEDGEWTGDAVDAEAALEDIRTGAVYHDSVIRLAGKWARAGVPQVEAINRLRRAFDDVPKALRDQRWRDRVNALTRTVKDIYRREARQEEFRSAEIIRLFNEPDPEADAAMAEDKAVRERKTEKQRDDDYAKYFVSPADCLTSLTETTPYIVKGMILEQSINVIFGLPNAGKSVSAPHIAYGVAQGRSVFGMKVKRCPVIYASYEGPHGMRKRIAALHQEHGDAPDLHLGTELPTLLGDRTGQAKGRRILLDQVKRLGVGLVVIDTIGASFAGMDENTSEGMGEVLALAQDLKRLGAAVILIHHPSRAGNIRGFSGLDGGIDMMLRVEKSDKGVVVATSEKTRDTGSFTFQYRNRVVVTGVDEEGDDISTVICEEVADDGMHLFAPLTENESALLDALRKMVNDDDSAPRDPLRELCLADQTYLKQATRTARRNAFNRAEDSLKERDSIAIKGNRVTLLEES